MTWDPVGARMLGITDDDPRQLVEVNLATGALTRLGDTHTAAELTGRTMDAIFFAPAPTCP